MDNCNCRPFTIFKFAFDDTDREPEVKDRFSLDERDENCSSLEGYLHKAKKRFFLSRGDVAEIMCFLGLQDENPIITNKKKTVAVRKDFLICF